jgi:hypothetical protein
MRLREEGKLTKHCLNCRKKDTDRIAWKKKEAEARGKLLGFHHNSALTWASGLRYCIGCRQDKPEAQFTENGVLFMRCNDCRPLARAQLAEKRRTVRTEALSNPHNLPQDEIVDDDDYEGVQTEKPAVDEFDDEFDDMQIPEDFPDDLAVSQKGLKCIKKFLAADTALKREVCPSCQEADWNMRVQQGKCQRCRRDKKETRSFCAENLTNPSKQFDQSSDCDIMIHDTR